MTAALALFTNSFQQALPLRRTAGLALLQLVPLAIWLLATTDRTEQSAFDTAVEIGLGTFFVLVLPLVTIVVAAGVLGNERRDLTLSFIALRPIPRTVIAGAKFLAAFAAAALLNSLGAVALGIGYAVRFGGWDLMVGLLLGAVVATAAYAAAFVPFGFLTDRAVIVGIAYLLVVENGVIFAVSGLALLSPWRLGATVFADTVDGARIVIEDALGGLTSQRALLAMLVYVVVGVVATTQLLRRRDLA